MKDYTKGEAIRIIREWTNLTQKDFAKRIILIASPLV